MTNKEVIIELRSKLKPYVGIMSPSHFSQMCSKIQNEMCKPKTVDKFFILFGYIGTWNDYKSIQDIEDNFKTQKNNLDYYSQTNDVFKINETLKNK